MRAEGAKEDMTKPSQGYTVLVADDEPEVVDLVRMMLEWEGYAILAAVDGEEAVARAQADQPDLILLDVRMPKMSGLNVLNHLRADPTTADIPVIMLSVVTTYPDVRSALERGAVAYLPKPFELREMVRLVARVLAMDTKERETLQQQAIRDIGRVW
jgi:CheY-like chemotaxis protein